MRFMNDYDLDSAARRYNPAVTPNRAYLVAVVSALRNWTDRNSDGWAYWPKPVRAAARAIELIDSSTTAENDRRAAVDATDAETAAALSVIRSFLTRQGVAHESVLPAR